MNQTDIPERGSTAPEADGEASMVDLLIFAAKHKKKIISAALVTAVLAAGLSLLMPNIYQASTRLLPPQQTQSSAAALLSQLGGIAGAAAGVAGMKNPSDLYIGMLKSRTVADRLVEKFDLRKVYGTNSIELARKKLISNTTFTSGKDGLILVEVEDTDKKRVTQLANGYVAELFGLMKTLAVTDASQRRLFYEGQLEATKDKLSKAEIALKSTMDSHGVVSVDAESRAMLETAARLKAQTAAKEIQLRAMSAFVTTNNVEYRRVEEELAGLRAELSKLENGRGVDLERDKPAGLENIKLLRDLKYQQMLYEVLAKQYEVARIDEAKDPSVIQVLDVAVEPERKFKPKRSIITLVGLAVGVVLGAFWAFLVEWKEGVYRRPESPEYARLMALKKNLRWKQS